ncbi:MAG: bifunctional 5,10-methylenetetrahydrofolate dehydrogenase/5,10-methenyltetrahydrofolate cyclohydrolase [Candidatus Spechtbacterales bacterium]|nr:bifunctional 5,10-methylenetetrahydrofolate dehydrogenase/5,10-methenyltetrahydrofolate cyclohydrolase [Candidatus Spechtbacterales bacterium]
MAEILDGKKISDKILSELKKDIKKLNREIKLGVVMVGANAVSEKYVAQKKEIGRELGIEVRVYKYDKDITTKKLRKQIGDICRVPNMGGVIVQLPLPGHINTQSVLDAVLPEKDVDILSSKTLGKFYTGKSQIIPPTVSGIIKLLEEYNIETEGKNVVIIGQGRLVGKPAAVAFARRGATIISINKNTKNKEELIKKSDIIISGAGKPGLIKGDMVKEGAVVIDAGTTSEEGEIRGDVAEDAKEVAAYLTPVPGGVGPMTVAMLFYNLVKLNK